MKTYCMVVVGVAFILASLIGCEKPPAPQTSYAPFFLKSDVEINAPVEKVFAYTDDLERLPEWNPRVGSISDIVGSGLGLTVKWIADYRGREIKGESIFLDYVPNQKVTIAISPANQIWNFIYQPDGENRTKLIFTMSGFTIVQKTPDGVVQMFTAGEQQEFMETVLGNLKVAVEKQGE